MTRLEIESCRRIARRDKQSNQQTSNTTYPSPQIVNGLSMTIKAEPTFAVELSERPSADPALNFYSFFFQRFWAVHLVSLTHHGMVSNGMNRPGCTLWPSTKINDEVKAPPQTPLIETSDEYLLGPWFTCHACCLALPRRQPPLQL